MNFLLLLASARDKQQLVTQLCLEATGDMDIRLIIFVIFLNKLVKFIIFKSFSRAVIILNNLSVKTNFRPLNDSLMKTNKWGLMCQFIKHAQLLD